MKISTKRSQQSKANEPKSKFLLEFFAKILFPDHSSSTKLMEKYGVYFMTIGVRECPLETEMNK